MYIGEKKYMGKIKVSVMILNDYLYCVFDPIKLSSSASSLSTYQDNQTFNPLTSLPPSWYYPQSALSSSFPLLYLSHSPTLFFFAFPYPQILKIWKKLLMKFWHLLDINFSKSRSIPIGAKFLFLFMER